MELHQTDEARRTEAEDRERWLTIAEAAAFLRVTATAVAGAATRGELPVVCGPRSTMVDRVALLNLMRRPLPVRTQPPHVVIGLRLDRFVHQPGKEVAS